MRVNWRMRSALLIVFVLSLSMGLPAAAQSINAATFTRIDFVANIGTIGVAVSGTGLPSTAQLSYRQSGTSTWHPGHSLMRIDDGRLIGSLFNLLPATSYEIKVGDGATEITGLASTQPDGLSFTPSVILHVDDNALPGGNGSVAAPFQTIQAAVDHAGPGTQVLVADGIYREAVTFPASGTSSNWIQVKAAGNAAILDSANYLSGAIWTTTSTAKVWFTNINGPVAYLARGGNRFYQYDDKTGLMQARGHGGVTINEGWYYEASTQKLYIRNLDNPANYMWRVPRLNHAFDVVAHDWIWIEGFETRFYGTTTNGCGVCTINASHIVIRRNKIHNMQLGIFINWNGTSNQGNDTRIEGNEVYDPLVNEWPWTAVKGSFMEGTGIIIRGHIGAIVRDNNVHNFFNGIYTGSSGALENSELAFDADIYNNYIHHVSDDGLEPEGACVNQRFRNNTVDRGFIGLSVAPITQGPTWVLRNVFTNFTGRGIKYANNSDGMVLIYHNTGWTNASNINGADLITSVHNVKMRNNIFQTSGYSFYEVPTGSTGNDWNYDNWYTTRGSTGPHFKWENVNYNTISALCTASGLECNGHENLPGFANPTGGDFTLLSSSSNIDRGVVILGINDDFAGNGPDVGAYESAFGSPPTVTYVISGNVGIGGVTLTYTDGTPLFVMSDGSGNYSIIVPAGWNGTVIPYKIGYAFTPVDKPYGNVQSNQTNQNYTAQVCASCADADTVGVFRPSNGLLYLKNLNLIGYADVAINYGIGGDYPVVGDWDGDGDDTIGVYRNGVFYLRNSNTVGIADIYFAFGSPGDQPVAGDWNGDGVDTIGVYHSSNFTFSLRNSNTTGAPDAVFQLGIPGDVGIAGDWNGDGSDTTGVFRPSNGVIFLKNTNVSGYADIGINYGIGGDKPVTGDWNNDGIDTIGVLRGNTFYLRNSNTVGYADMWFALGIPGDMPIAGNWDALP